MIYTASDLETMSSADLYHATEQETRATLDALERITPQALQLNIAHAWRLALEYQAQANDILRAADGNGTDEQIAEYERTSTEAAAIRETIRTIFRI